MDDGERIEPSSNGSFQVSEDVAERLLADDGIDVERYEAEGQ